MSYKDKVTPAPATNPQVGLSNCCNAPTHFVPACFGDSSFTLCSHCNTDCQIVWKPMYEKVSQGIYSKIEYKVNILTPLGL